MKKSEYIELLPIAHIFKKGSMAALCSLGSSNNPSVPKRVTRPVSDDSVPCESCFYNARTFFSHPSYRVDK